MSCFAAVFERVWERPLKAKNATTANEIKKVIFRMSVLQSGYGRRRNADSEGLSDGEGMKRDDYHWGRKLLPGPDSQAEALQAGDGLRYDILLVEICRSFFLRHQPGGSQ